MAINRHIWSHCPIRYLKLGLASFSFVHETRDIICYLQYCFVVMWRVKFHGSSPSEKNDIVVLELNRVESRVQAFACWEMTTTKMIKASFVFVEKYFVSKIEASFVLSLCFVFSRNLKTKICKIKLLQSDTDGTGSLFDTIGWFNVGFNSQKS